MTRTRLGGFAGMLLAVAFAAPLTAQQDARWAAFVGCWVPVGAGGEALLCFRPSGGGVEMFNVSNGEVTATESVMADGVARSVTAEGCTGSERVEFSADGLRAYTRSDFQCGSETRSGTGVMSFVSASEWIDVRSLTVAGEPVAWAQNYELASGSLIEAQGIEDPAATDASFQRAARVRASRGLEVAHVEDASSRLETRALEVWVAAHETPLELTGSELVRLADAGMPESVIDVMIAVTYPERFRVSPEGAPAEEQEVMAARGYPVGPRRGYRSYLFDPFYRGMAYGIGYSRFGYYGYDGFGGYGGYWGYQPATIVVQPAQPSIVERVGRMVPGLGYTRGGSSGGSGGSSGAGGEPSRSSGSGGGGGGGSSSGGSSDGGSSGGGGGSSSGRTAQPRN
ncbi:MAG: hypothetical protein FJ207_09880 [Gemmatimonadetes bacterium]|nr:hypothetical protein [Gemmatimonadota bacterium]